MSKSVSLYSGELRNISIKKFLECYGKQECLWNSRLSSYKDKGARHEAYEQIIKELNMNGITHNDIRAKIKGVRTTYKKELETSLFKKSKGLPHEPKLSWFKQADAFLRSVSTSRKPKYPDKVEENVIDQNTKIATQVLNPSIAMKRRETMSEDETHNQCEDEKVNPNNISFEGVQTEEGYPYEDYVEEHTFIKEDQTSHAEKHNPNNSSASIQTYYRVEPPRDDDYQQFCNSVAAQLRSIPDAYSRSVAKFKIQQILFEAETGHYKKSACVTIPITH
ncbi:uncharacterized protein LOC129618810 [Condylostylus longicornis]|uniref:uncharacterized protein LOC129618810 n=1 Tax=Condylostylus longicornis TaxID=2530218 RepID=UPI00244DEFB5|nr:uncharacterized protein LOC129618810 [Condylostylus longicornis]